MTASRSPKNVAAAKRAALLPMFCGRSHSPRETNAGPQAQTARAP
eukprot:CAMPEP_0184102318 /NCGR_PEP_ID=MMETSP0974-20121125/13283_1 /TAXON_ID=483370 /ORGANISM="non described non described, Strain CCMP2097" /LENGTH=44 /DNA_ID= /DNA_START= /DNA_END= /DNA_ORIENTATION=